MKQWLVILLAAVGLAMTAGAQAQLTWTTSTAPQFGPGRIQMHGTAVTTTAGRTFIHIISGNSQWAGADDTRIYYSEVTGSGLTTALSNFTTATYVFPVNNAVYMTRSCVGWGDKIYCVGGRFNAGGSVFNGIRVFEVQPNGDVVSLLQSYDGTPYSPALDRLESAAVINPATGILYIAGGGNPAVPQVQRVQIDPVTGQVTGAVTTAGTLPVALRQGTALILNNRLYYVAGSTGSDPVPTAVYYADILPSGDLGTFNTATAPLPAGRYDGGAVVYRGTIYVIGGTDTTVGGSVVTNNASKDTVWQATMGPGGDITGWTVDTSIPIAPATSGGFRRVGAVVAGNTIVVVGGRQNNTDISDLARIGYEPPAAVEDWSLF
ncbi:MAG: hypothetical protein N2111_11500 [Candidatus Sumerlaeaceae bacterium]|nr:hypothetical protein [Candidatus Sumerlaeaceae bacterium]